MSESDQAEKVPHIGTLNEKPLHAALKQWVSEPGDAFEVPLDGYFIDVVRDDLLIEIQTASFSSLKRKLRKLTKYHKVRLVHPIAAEKWLIQLPKDGIGKPKRRKSPKRGSVYHLFVELVAFPDLICHPNFELEIALTQEDEVRKFEGHRARRRRKGWVIEERRLLNVVESRLFKEPADFANLLPQDLPEQFTTKDIAAGLAQPKWLVQKMAYCLRKMDAIQLVGKRGKFSLYQMSSKQ
ncbi:MAG: hypothetical protein AAF902_08065 [Chloroflexota bacterium]